MLGLAARLGQSLISCRPSEDHSHELRRFLTGFCCLATQLTIDGRWKGNIGNDKSTGRQHVRSELPLQNRVELPHAIPLLGIRQIRARDDRAKGRDDDIRQLSVGNVWLQNL